jgi:pimeloyl-ACP methyl ester carboxylesterase
MDVRERRVAGAGPPLLLVHGLAGSWRWWSAALEPLAAVREVHVLDVAAPPARAAEAVLAWADERRLDRFGLVGHSLGGATAARVAAASKRVSELVLVSAVGMPSGRSPLAYGLPLAAALRTTSPSFLRLLTLDAARWGVPRLLAGALHATRADVTAEARAIRAPTLLVWGGRDPLVPAALATAWREAIPHARLVTIAGAGHVPMVERPAEFASAVRGFLDEPRDGVGRAPVRDVGAARDDDEPPAREPGDPLRP